MPGEVIGLRVEREPEDPRRLALQLADAIQAASRCQADAEAFQAAARAERAKARDLMFTITRVREHKRRKPTPGEVRSRMDPMATYDIPIMEGERAQFLRRAETLSETAAQNLRDAAAHRAKAQELEVKLEEVRRGRS